ncbi:putative 5'-nucleotidase [Heterostelium album PN500]|uniref:Putative 5'-nucleotidase n=1 Tax=Heterostelium pallidum (strain ATCC 26659 / Pp 5 / PN500) TaxID=670386 RepID=D3AWY0_HETP5|nr:putative 5'-nucleotidase [Heterostelium album PN500]EFA86803.1 putative 5'-nucleotidase [Heterostelium album PN500]|eukprot:XP_020438906.1 putative 5'-nucleotidase [Heterostelium album PN500]
MNNLQLVKNNYKIEKVKKSTGVGLILMKHCSDRSTVLCNNKIIMDSIETNVVNREIELHQQLKHLDCIGFDMDMTITKFDIDQVHRGVIVDTVTGYMLKLDSQKHVLKAFLGDLQISKEKINDIYHADVIPENRPLAQFSGSNNGRFFVLNSFFELPLTPLWIGHINHLVAESGVPDGTGYDHGELMRFLKEAVVSFNHSFGDFYNSRYFREIREDPGKFVHRATDACIAWLKDLKSRGCRVCLITNSKSEYTHLLMTYAYGPDFQSIFDIIIADAKKPEFFRKPAKFYDLGGNYFPKELTEEMLVDAVEFNTPTVYHNGSVQTLIEAVRRHSNKENISFCYVGDHLIGDVSAPKQHCKWMTIAIVEEIEDEEEIVVLQKKTAGFESKGIGKNYEWGSFFCFNDHNAGISSETFWSYVIRHNADIALSSVETLAKYFNDDKFDKQSLKPCSIVYN